MVEPQVTIVICTYNRSELLPETLPSIANQTLDETFFNVLFVNNNSTDNTQEIIKKFCLEHQNAQSVNEPNQGLSHARNRGFAESKTKWIAYIDDDAKISENYMELLVTTIDKYDFDCIGGLYLPWYKYGKPNWYLDKYASNGKLLPKAGLIKNRYASGGVLSVKKSILEQLGGFPSTLGMHGKKIAYGEEIHLQDSMRKMGYKIGFNPELIIYHLVSRSKMSPWWFVMRGFAEGRDYWVIHGTEIKIKDLFKLSYRIFYNLLFKGFKYSLKVFESDYFWQNWVIDVLGTTATILGQFLKGLQLYIKRSTAK